MTDPIDSALISALRADPRAPLRALGEAVGESEQATARRCRRLFGSGRVRVVATYRDVRARPWSLRIVCSPESTRKVATLLAERSETSWVHLLSGGTKIVCLAQVADASTLLERLARTVVEVEAQLLLQAFRLPNGSPPAVASSVVLDATDRALLHALSSNARASYAALARAAKTSEATARRRLERLIASGILGFEVEEPFEGLETRLWLDVEPRLLVRTGESFARWGAVTFAAATTGTTNLTAVVRTASAEGLYRFMTTKLARLGIRRAETATIASTLKRGGLVPIRPFASS